MCPVVPVFFEGVNSVGFHLAGVVHPGLRTASLPREFHKMCGKTLRVRIGTAIPPDVMSGYRDPALATAYLRSRTFFLSNRHEPAHVALQAPALRAPAAGRSEESLVAEVAGLAPECELTSNGGFSVYLARPSEIPRLLQEIGCCRELAFHQVGEGTGKQADLDSFDDYYQHLFLWSKNDHRLAGAYRLAVTTDILPQRGVQGLYSSTLFRFDPRLFDRIGPAVELGRSFVMPEYQKSYASLLLLWKAIMLVVQRRPEAPLLFGAVSISRDYNPASRGLIATYLAGKVAHDLAGFVRPRRPFRHRVMRDGQIQRFAELASGIDDVSRCVADIEGDGKGIPVLLRQYLKAGGRILGFNVDPSFSDALDALLLVDLRDAPLPLLERCMGRTEVQAFLESHGRSPLGAVIAD
jgi:putative hemolysin